jgi:hypothetical protein
LAPPLPRASSIAILAAIFLFSFLWIVVSNYSDAVVCGTYHLRHSSDSSILILKPDRTFDQELTRSGRKDYAHGTWHTLGQGGISFSKEFLAVKGEEVEPDETSFADIQKPFGIFITLQMRQYHVLWYGRQGTTEGTSPVGTYAGDEPGVSAMLTLGSDNSFVQEVTRAGISAHAQDTWTMGNDGEIVFSKAFLKTSGEPLQDDESAIVENPQQTNLQVVIKTTSKSGTPEFSRNRIAL